MDILDFHLAHGIIPPKRGRKYSVLREVGDWILLKKALPACRRCIDTPSKKAWRGIAPNLILKAELIPIQNGIGTLIQVVGKE